MMFPVPGLASSMCSIRAAISSGAWSQTGISMPHGGSLSWMVNFGSVISVTGAFIEQLMRADGTPLQFDGLWDMLPVDTGVLFTAGIAGEAHGLFGLITE